MSSRQGGYSAQFDVTTVGVKELSAFLRYQINARDLNVATRTLRQGSKEIAKDIVMPAIQAAASASPISIAPAIAATAMPLADRVVVVKLGRKNPKLSGYKRGTYQGTRTSLAFGGSYGPHPKGRRTKGGGTPDSPINAYGAPRWTGLMEMVSQNPLVMDRVKEAYSALFSKILNAYGKYT